MIERDNFMNSSHIGCGPVVKGLPCFKMTMVRFQLSENDFYNIFNWKKIKFFIQIYWFYFFSRISPLPLRHSQNRGHLCGNRLPVCPSAAALAGRDWREPGRLNPGRHCLHAGRDRANRKRFFILIKNIFIEFYFQF